MFGIFPDISIGLIFVSGVTTKMIPPIGGVAAIAAILAASCQTIKSAWTPIVCEDPNLCGCQYLLKGNLWIQIVCGIVVVYITIRVFIGR